MISRTSIGTLSGSPAPGAADASAASRTRAAARLRRRSSSREELLRLGNTPSVTGWPSRSARRASPRSRARDFGARESPAALSFAPKRRRRVCVDGLLRPAHVFVERCKAFINSMNLMGLPWLSSAPEMAPPGPSEPTPGFRHAADGTFKRRSGAPGKGVPPTACVERW
jgi:hypothetical protein